MVPDFASELNGTCKDIVKEKFQDQGVWVGEVINIYEAPQKRST